LKWYEEQFRLLQKQKYGASSEKTNEDQMSLPLFNEAEDTADPKVEEPALDTITYTRKKKRKTRDESMENLPGLQGIIHTQLSQLAGFRKTRDESMENLPVEIIEYELSPEDQVCSCCGLEAHKMSEEIRRE